MTNRVRTHHYLVFLSWDLVYFLLDMANAVGYLKSSELLTFEDCRAVIVSHSPYNVKPLRVTNTNDVIRLRRVNNPRSDFSALYSSRTSSDLELIVTADRRRFLQH